MTIQDEIQVLGKMTGVIAKVLGELPKECFGSRAIAPAIRVLSLDRVELVAGGTSVVLTSVLSNSGATVTARVKTAATGFDTQHLLRCDCTETDLDYLAKDIIESIS